MVETVARHPTENPVQTHYKDDYAMILRGDVLDCLRSLPGDSVHCCVTSPPYWGLRDYGTGTWSGGSPECNHAVNQNPERSALTSTLGGSKRNVGNALSVFKGGTCPRCGARRVDQQLGSEALHDCAGWATGDKCGQCFVCHMVAVFAEVYRVLRPDGTVWLNIGDSYNGSGGSGGDYAAGGLKDGQPRFAGRNVPSLKPKDLALVPERLALALQAAGWYVRSQIVWAKKAPMPEGVRDRPVQAWEPIWLLAKSRKYFYDAEAIREAHSDPNVVDGQFQGSGGVNRADWEPHTQGWNETGLKMENRRYNPNGRNSRNVWLLGPEPYPQAHFATFPREIPRRAIKAGTSERGCCPNCGKSWVRITEPTEEYAQHLGAGYHDHGNDGEAGQMQAKRPGFKSVSAERVTVGWRQACRCKLAEPVPCTVLDPFLGSGTSGEVANALGRYAIGCDLKAEYLDLALRRMRPAKGLQKVMIA